MPDVSALGAALLAGLKIGLYPDLESLKKMNRDQQYYVPGGKEKAERDYEGWVQSIVASR